MAEKYLDLLAAAKKRLDYDKDGPGMTVIVVADTGTYPPLRDAVHAAAVASGADVSLLVYQALEHPFDDVSAFVEETITRADYTYMLPSQVWFYNSSSERVRGIQRLTSKRVQSWEGTEAAVPHFLALLPGNDEVVARTHKMGEMLFKVKNIRVTSAAGTDLTFERGDPKRQLMNNSIGQVNYSPLTIETRMAIAAGDNTPPKETCAGTLMFQGAYRTVCPGPTILKSLVSQPVRIQIDRGRITQIARDTDHGAFLDNWFRSWDDPTVYFVDHFNIGLDHRIHLDNLSVHHNYGGILLGFGICFSSNRGDLGVFRAKAHIEIQLTGASVFFDDKQIIKDGEFTEESGVQRSVRRPGVASPFLKVDGHVLPEVATVQARDL